MEAPQSETLPQERLKCRGRDCDQFGCDSVPCASHLIHSLSSSAGQAKRQTRPLSHHMRTLPSQADLGRKSAVGNVRYNGPKTDPIR